MDLRKIKKLIALLEESALCELEISEGDSTIRLSRERARNFSAPPETSHATPHVHVPHATPASSLSPSPSSPSPSPPPPPENSPGEIVVSPLVGTFYDAPSPQDEPYVRAGAEVKKGDTLCLIEAMKTFNQLEAEFDGIVRVVHKNGGDPVEYGEPLFVIERRDG